MKKIFFAAVFVTSSWALFAQDTSSRTNNGTQTNNSTNGQWNNNTGNQMNNSTHQSTNTNAMSNNQTYNSTSTSDYSAYGIPNYVQQDFEITHPNTSSLMWDRPTADWYHGYYTDNGRYTNVYYSTDPYYNSTYYPERVTGYSVSLPVLQTYVPDGVISTATNMYKQNLYDITALKGNNNQSLYQVRILDNGQIRTMWIDSAGTSTADIYRTEQNMNSNVQTSDVNTMNSTQSNAAMDHSNSEMHHSNNDMHHKNMKHKNVKTKTKKITSDGRKIITKTKNGKTRTWTENNNNDQQ